MVLDGDILEFLSLKDGRSIGSLLLMITACFLCAVIWCTCYYTARHRLRGISLLNSPVTGHMALLIDCVIYRGVGVMGLLLLICLM